MKPRYDTYYRTIPDLGGKRHAAESADRPARAPSCSSDPAVRHSSVLEAFHPEIAQAVTLLWGYPEMNAYFEKLWLADGNQAPIAPEAMSELMLLAGVHRWLSPPRPERTMASIYDASAAPLRQRNVWDDVPRRR
jgi:hypothetical protein